MFCLRVEPEKDQNSFLWAQSKEKREKMEENRDKKNKGEKESEYWSNNAFNLSRRPVTLFAQHGFNSQEDTTAIRGKDRASLASQVNAMLERLKR